MQRPNILLLFTDEHSFRFMGHRSSADGGEDVSTPNFDALAAQSMVFTDTYCQMPLCTPSRICMLTGRHVQQAGAWDNASVLRPQLSTLPARLRDSGYTTALIGKMHLGGTQQFVGFEHRPYGDMTGQCGHQHEPPQKPATGMRERTNTDVGVTTLPESMIQDNVVANESLAFLRENRHANPDKPWMLCASFSHPHFPLRTPKRFLDMYWPDKVSEPMVPATGDAWDHPMCVAMRKGFRADEVSYDEMMYARACYFACVSYIDEIIGDMLASLERDGLLDNTIIIYTTDHGELAGEHGVWWKNGWYEGCTRVPMMISMPAHRSGELTPGQHSQPAALIDLMPTLLTLAGCESEATCEGTDLSEVLTTAAPAPERTIYCDALTPRFAPGTEFRMARRGQYKVVIFRYFEPLAFDLDADPGEQNNLLKKENEQNVPQEVKQLLTETQNSIDFEAAEHDRVVRDGELKTQYAQKVNPGTRNLFLLPCGELVSADSNLYQPQTVATNLTDAFGENWQKQNSV